MPSGPLLPHQSTHHESGISWCATTTSGSIMQCMRNNVDLHHLAWKLQQGKSLSRGLAMACQRSAYGNQGTDLLIKRLCSGCKINVVKLSCVSAKYSAM